MSRRIKIFIDEKKVQVGTLWFDAKGNRESSGMEYSAEWIDAPEGFAIDPGLPLRHGRFFHAHKQGGSVFFGAIADTEPDGWGRQVILRTHGKKRNGGKGHDFPLSSLDFLLAVDDFSRIGALRFQDELGVFQRPIEKGQGSAPPLIELSHLYSATRAVETDTETAADLEYLRGKGTSLGGLRPKCTVLGKDGSLSIGKFPSVNDLHAVTKGEVLALHIASRAGINAAEAHIVESDGIPVALIKRFDREAKGKRIPYISAATLLGIEDTREVHTYTELVDALKLNSDNFQADAEELWRRIALNILITNVDDHLRNQGFLLVKKDFWKLSPAFDINPYPHKRRTLKTWISDKTGDIASIQALVDQADYFGINFKKAREILLAVEAAVSNWRLIGKNLGMTTKELDAFVTAFEHEERTALHQICRKKS